MKDFIKSKLNESLEYYHSKGMEPESKESSIGLKEYGGEEIAYDELQRDVQSVIKPIVRKYQNSFGIDSYGVIDKIYQALDDMFPRV